MTANSVNNAINKVKSTATVQRVFGWILALFNGLIASVGMTQISEALDVILVLFFAGITALGVMLILKGKKKNQTHKNIPRLFGKACFGSGKVH